MPGLYYRSYLPDKSLGFYIVVIFYNIDNNIIYYLLCNIFLINWAGYSRKVQLLMIIYY